MIVRIAIVVAGIIVAGVFLNLYYAVFAFFTVFLLGIDSATVFTIQYWLCFGAGALTSFFLMRQVWPRSPQAGTAKEENMAREQLS